MKANEITLLAKDNKLNKTYPPITLRELLMYLLFQPSPNSEAYKSMKDHFDDIEWEIKKEI